MRSLLEFAERPLGTVLALLAISSLVAIVFFLVGGSFAEVTGQQDTLLGFGFKAGGVLAAYLIVFVLASRQLGELRKSTPPASAPLFREYLLRTTGKGLDLRDAELACEYRLYDREEGGWQPWKPIEYVRAQGGLQISVREMQPRHNVSVRLRDSQAQWWQASEDQAYGFSSIYLEPPGANKDSG